MYDVIVVGAGCAGPAAAKRAAELGLKTILFEKARKPGEKNVSGTCLNMAALVDPDLRYIMKGPVEREITELTTYMINDERTTIIHEKPTHGLILLSIRRDTFDAWHTEQAEKAGAEIVLATSIVDIIEEKGAVCGVKTDSGEEYYAKVVIDAAGVNSIVGRKADLISKRAGEDMILYMTINVYLGEEEVTERFGNAIHYFLAPNVQYKTWPWIFPKKDVVTLGTGGYLDDVFLNGKYRSVSDYMQNFLDLPIVKEKLEGGKIVSTGIHLEFDSELEQRVKNGLILTGEAGGFVIPFLGEGMVEAFFTGIYAAEAAAKAIAANDISRAKLEGYYLERISSNAFLQTFRYIAQKNKESILSKPDEEIIDMIQNVVISGGFISNVIHTLWMKGAEEGNIGYAQEAYDFYKLIQPYRQVGINSYEIYKETSKK
jgi:flavin-dependent dehydrogenase